MAGFHSIGPERTTLPSRHPVDFKAGYRSPASVAQGSSLLRQIVSRLLSGFAVSAVSRAATGFNDLFEKASPTVSGSIAIQGAGTNH